MAYIAYYGNDVFDMRDETSESNLSELHSVLDAMDAYQPSGYSVLVRTPTYIVVRASVPPLGNVDVSFWVSGADSYSVSLSQVAVEISSIGLYVQYTGNISIAVASGSMSGTFTSVLVRNQSSGCVAEVVGNLSLTSSGDMYGTIDSSTVRDLDTGQLVGSITNVNLPVDQITDDMSADALYAIILGGSDTITGGSHSDYLLGLAGSDQLIGLGGNDTLNGGTGADTLVGGSGNDTYVVDSSGDRIFETTTTASTSDAGGTDHVNSSITVNLSTYAGVSFIDNLRLTGNASINGTGNALNNVIYPNRSANQIDGGTGNDTVSYQFAATAGSTGVTLNLGGTVNASGFVSASGISGADKVKNIENVIGSNYADNLAGNGLANTLRGRSGNDTLFGGNGTDMLFGEANSDLLRGGLGNDTLTGGTGQDRFRFDTALSTAASQNVDRIMDFAVADDTIELENAIFTRFGTGTIGTINASTFRANTTGLAQDSNDYIIYETDTGKLFYDTNGSGIGGAGQIALLNPNLALTSADFVLV